jgi:hypothetical protein
MPAVRILLAFSLALVLAQATAARGETDVMQWQTESVLQAAIFVKGRNCDESECARRCVDPADKSRLV